MKILVVDDEKPILDLFTDMLSSYGYRNLTASSVKEAIGIIETEKDINARTEA